MRRNRTLEEAANAVLDRDVDRASAAALMVQEVLGSARDTERINSLFYHDTKKIAVFLVMAAAVALQLGAYYCDPKRKLGGMRKKRSRSVEQARG